MDYKNGKIYMLEPTCEYDEGDVYYGNCATTLVKRLSEHKCKSNPTSSKYLIEKYGRDNIKIVLIKLFPCNSKDELRAEEGKYQRENKCVNKRIEGRTGKEYNQDNREKIREYNKEHYQDHKEEKKEYYQDNRDKILEYQKEHRQANHEKISEYKKEHRQANRDKINARRRELRAEKKQSLNTI